MDSQYDVFLDGWQRIAKRDPVGHFVGHEYVRHDGSLSGKIVPVAADDGSTEWRLYESFDDSEGWEFVGTFDRAQGAANFTSVG